MLERNRLKSLQAPQPTPHAIYESQFLHGNLPPNETAPLPQIWPIYYPPEAYPSVLGNDELSQGRHSFRELTPQMPDSPEVPPFNFASSSLSAALSDPPRTSLPLPPVPDEETVDNNRDSEPEPVVASTSYSPPCHSVPYELDTISPAQLSIHHCANSNSQFETVDKPPTSRFSDFPSPPASSSSSPQWRSPYISSTDSLPLPDDSQLPGRIFDYVPSDTSVGPEASSSSSSPFVPPSSLSPADSPLPCSPDLPPLEHLPVDSLLFSPSSYYYRVAPSKRQKKVRPRKPPKALGESRLSSLLPLSSEYAFDIFERSIF